MTATAVTTNYETTNTTNFSTTVHDESVAKHAGGHHELPPYYILFIFGSFGVGAILRILLRKWANFVGDWKWGSLLKVPYTVFLLIIGMILAAVGLQYPDQVQPYLLSEMDPELFLHVFLPVVIFESAYVIDIHVFWRSIGHVSLLSVPGLLMATVLTAALSLVIPEIGNISSFEAKVYIALIFGSIISATDPVAVVALLKDLGSQKYLGTIIEGEALLNDGAAIVVFKIFLELLKSMTPFFESQTALSTFQLVVQQSFLGPILGWALARVGSFILQHIYNDALAEITVTLSFTYITFYFGEICKTSGVLAVVTFGLALDRSSITPQVDHFLHRFWEMLAYLSNTLIFVIVGIEITNHMEEITIYDIGYLMVIYIGITAIRGLSIFCFFPVMQRLGIEITWRHVLVMTYGGLRGAVGLALAIYLNSYVSILSPVLHGSGHALHDNLTTTPYATTDSSMYDPTADIDFDVIFQKILMHTGGIVLLTLVINASTIEAVMKKLGMLDVTNAQQITMLNAVNRIQENVRRSVAVLKYDRFLADAKWSIVENYTNVEYPYKDFPSAPGGFGGKMELGGEYDMSLQVCQSHDETFKDMFEEARVRMIKALKMSYGKQYSNGMLTDQEARVLIAAADTAADKPGEFINVETIRKNWEITGILPYAKRKLEDWMYGKKQSALVPPRNRQLRKIFRIVMSNWFEYVMQCIIVLNIIPIVLDFAVDETWDNVDDWWLALQLVNIVFIIAYSIEAGLRLAGMGTKQFIESRWNQFDVIILLFSFVELIIDFALVETSPGGGSIVKTVKTTKVIKFGKITKLIRMLRATRLLRLSKSVLPETVKIIDNLICRKLSFGYNVGKGFVTAEEEVNKLIVSISDNKKIQKRLLAASDTNRLSVTREMGLLQRDYAGIAISVKTKNAVRTILNHSKEAIHQLCSGGVLDEIEMQLLERNVEIAQKRLSDFPSIVSPPIPEDLLENIFWIQGNPGLLEFVSGCATLMDYDYGDVIMQEDDAVDGIHIIISGMIRLVGSLHGYIQHLNLNAGGFKGTNMSSMAKKAISSSKDIDKTPDEEDFLGSGNIIGEIGLLTNCNRTCTITCETAVQTFFISTEDMEKAFDLHPGLKNLMWKVVGIRISTPLYLEHLEYQGLGVDKIHLHLSAGHIVELNSSDSMVKFTDQIKEISVVHGTVRTRVGKEVLQSPYLVLPEADELHLHECEFAILLIIPRELALEIIPSGIALHRQSIILPSATKFQNSMGRKVSKVTPIQEEEGY